MRGLLNLPRQSYQSVTIESDHDGTTLRVADANCVVSVRMASIESQGSISMPFSDLRRAARSVCGRLCFLDEGHRVRVDTRSSGVVRSDQYESSPAVAEAAEPEWLISNDRSLGKALLEAAQICDPQATRESIRCLLLRGSGGDIVATDGRQAYRHSGFALPVDAVLIPAEHLALRGNQSEHQA